jgi:CRP/FNR family transcriptional regulator, cyclic AMP receptor protein
MSMLSNLELIRRVPLFAMLTPAQAEGVSEAVIKRRFKRGELIVEQGKKSNALFIILTGRCRVFTSDSRGREVILANMQPGDYIGEMSLIDNEPHSATVRAEVQTDVLMLGRLEFARCLPENTSMAYAVMKGLVQRLRSADRKIESLALMDVYGRVARALMEASEQDAQGAHFIRDGQPRDERSRRARLHRDTSFRRGADPRTAQYARLSAIFLRFCQSSQSSGLAFSEVRYHFDRWLILLTHSTHP